MSTKLQLIGFFGTKKPINCKIVDYQSIARLLTQGSSPQMLFTVISISVYACDYLFHSAGLELSEQVSSPPDIVIICCGGGGFLAGTALALKLLGWENTKIYGVEPEKGICLYIVPLWLHPSSSKQSGQAIKSHFASCVFRTVSK